MRQPGQYVDSGGNAYAPAQMQRMSGQRMEHKSNNYQGRADHASLENEKSYGALKGEGQWRWERDGSSHMFNEGQGADASRSYYPSQGQRSDQRLSSEKQGNDLRSQPREEDMEIGYEDNPAGQTFEGLEQRFYDDILKLAKEQNDAEDAENARHRERVKAINAQYEERLAAVRVRYANRREEFLIKESHARQLQYQQQAAMEQQYANSAYNAATAAAHVDSYRERPRFTGGNNNNYNNNNNINNNRDSRDPPGFDPRGQYPGGRVYGSASRYY